MLYWCMHYHDSLLGRAYLQLQAMLEGNPHQYHSQIIFHLLDCLGDKLLTVYKSNFRLTIQKLRTEYLPRYEQYIASGEIKSEVQN